MSYLQIELGGKIRGLKYNTMALIEYQKNINETNEMTLLISAVWAGLMANDYAKKNEVDYTFEEVCDWCDALENKAEIMAKISDAIAQTQEYKKVVSSNLKVAEEEEKKKVLKSKTTTT